MPRLTCAPIALALLWCAGCGSGDAGRIGAGVIGVKLTNHCELPVYASAIEDESEGFHRPIEVAPGERVSISLITNVAHRPNRYLLAYRIDFGSPPLVVEFPTPKAPRGRDKGDPRSGL